MRANAVPLLAAMLVAAAWWLVGQCIGKPTLPARVLFRDDFNRLDASVWWAPKGEPKVEAGNLVLSSTPGAGVEVQSYQSFRFARLQFRASSKHWPVDTSLGYEHWAGSVHRGIVVTNGHLGIIDHSQPGTNEWYQPIPHWEKLQGKTNVFTIIWKKGRVALRINGKPALTYKGPLVPDQALRIRFNASNDVADVVKVDYVVVKKS